MFIISKLCYLCVIHLNHIHTIQMTDQLTALYTFKFAQPLHAMENESEKNNNQIVLFKTVTHNISDYFRLT
jgi:hypothetical protein